MFARLPRASRWTFCALLTTLGVACEERRAAQAPAPAPQTGAAPAAPRASSRTSSAAPSAATPGPGAATEAGLGDPAPPSELVWVVRHAGQVAPGGEPRDRWHVALEVRAGDEKRRIEIGYATGHLLSESQRACGMRWPLDEKQGNVARVVFTYAGSIIYAVQRRAPTRYAVVELFDGHLEDGSLDKKELETFSLPLGDSPAERIVQEKDGTRSVLCP